MNLFTVKAQTSLRIRTVSPGPLLFSSNTGTDPLKNHKVTKPALNVGPSLVRQRNAISMAFRWRADVGPLMVVFGSSLPLSTKKKKKKTLTKSDPILHNFLDPRKMSLH